MYVIWDVYYFTSSLTEGHRTCPETDSMSTVQIVYFMSYVFELKVYLYLLKIVYVKTYQVPCT